MQKIVSVQATTLDDAWFQLVYNVLKHGRDFKIDQGSFAGSVRKEFDFVVIHILNPSERDVTTGMPLIPRIPEHMNIPNPVDDDYLISYAPYLLGSEVAEDEAYTYGQRINKEPVNRDIAREVARKGEIYRSYAGANSLQLENIVFDAKKFLSQVDLAIEVYKDYPRTNQMVLQVGKPTDILLIDPPCLRHIDTRIQDGKLHFYPYFRSWDLWSGLPANLAGISMLQEHMASEIGVEQGEMICTSKGLHLYDYSVSFAQMRCVVEGDDGKGF
jgi:thymidylate synthase